MLGTSTEKKPIAGVQSAPPTLPLWGPQWKTWIQHNFLRTAGVLGQVDVLPYEQNYLDLDPTHKDPQGYPLVRITFAPQQQEQLRAAFIIKKCVQWMKEMGATETWSFPDFPAVNVHAYGGARFGDDPDSAGWLLNLTRGRQSRGPRRSGAAQLRRS
jgi:gluconate 2-dehydrogenase alpha chain